MELWKSQLQSITETLHEQNAFLTDIKTQQLLIETNILALRATISTLERKVKHPLLSTLCDHLPLELLEICELYFEFNTCNVCYALCRKPLIVCRLHMDEDFEANVTCLGTATVNEDKLIFSDNRDLELWDYFCQGFTSSHFKARKQTSFPPYTLISHHMEYEQYDNESNLKLWRSLERHGCQNKENCDLSNRLCHQSGTVVFSIRGPCSDFFRVHEKKVDNKFYIQSFGLLHK